jgi:hypothetical protein
VSLHTVMSQNDSFAIHALTFIWRPSTTGCLYGDGYIKIFAGESAKDESALLALETAEFESELQIVSPSNAVVYGISLHVALLTISTSNRLFGLVLPQPHHQQIHQHLLLSPT